MTERAVGGRQDVRPRRAVVGTAPDALIRKRGTIASQKDLPTAVGGEVANIPYVRQRQHLAGKGVAVVMANPDVVCVLRRSRHGVNSRRIGTPACERDDAPALATGDIKLRPVERSTEVVPTACRRIEPEATGG